MKARIDGVFHTMMRFDFFFGLSLAIEILGQTDELATALQYKNLSAVQGKKYLKLLKKP